MRRSHFLQSSMSPLARLGVSALVGVVLAGVPTARALAAEGLDGASASASDDDAPITTLGEQLAVRKRDAGERLRGLVLAALQHTAVRVHEARDGMARVMAIGYGLEELASLDESEPSEQAEQVDDAEHDDATKVERERPRRFEYVEGTNDPLAGL